jgi:hypothetical protein
MGINFVRLPELLRGSTFRTLSNSAMAPDGRHRRLVCLGHSPAFVRNLFSRATTLR